MQWPCASKGRRGSATIEETARLKILAGNLGNKQIIRRCQAEGRTFGPVPAAIEPSNAVAE